MMTQDKDARIAELEAENERLRNMVDGYGKLDAEAAAADRKAEALSRTGAMKVEALVNSLLDLRDLIMRGKRCVTDTGPAVKPVIELAAVHILDDAANALEALSALEPAAPEGQQPVGVVWFGYDENTGEFTGESCSVEPHDSHRFRAYAPITTRPSEQAVTEADDE